MGNVEQKIVCGCSKIFVCMGLFFFFVALFFLCVYAAFIDLRNVTFLSHKVKGFHFIRFKERYIHPVLYYFMKLTAFFI